MRIIVTSGGTGGHIYPAISLIKYLENKGEEVLFVGNENGMEKEITEREGINFIGLNISRGNGIINKIKFFKNMVKSFFKAKIIFNKFKPDIVIGFGNYISFPMCIVAYLKNVPIFLHEQNSTMGKANVILGYIAKKIGYSIPLIKEYHKGKLKCVGNPRSSECFRQTFNVFDINVTKNNILIFMGSLGSSTINNILIKFVNENKDTNIYHIITGKKHYETFVKQVTIKENIKIYPYIDDMISLMKKCDLVITRSGATTISEIITLGLPSILIPSPYVVNNHQFYNASYLHKNNACVMLEEKDLSSGILKDNIDYLLKNNGERIKLRVNSLKLAVFDSNNKIYNIIKEMTHE